MCMSTPAAVSVVVWPVAWVMRRQVASKQLPQQTYTGSYCSLARQWMRQQLLHRQLVWCDIQHQTYLGLRQQADQQLRQATAGDLVHTGTSCC